MRPDTNLAQASPSKDSSVVRPVAVIDIGTTSVRMTVAEIAEEGKVRRLEDLSQPASLGRDTFRRGSLRKGTIRDVVRILEEYRRVIGDYGIDGPARVRALGTSAVAEAANRTTLLDRIEIATGFRVAVIDPAEINRLTYLGLLPSLREQPELTRGRTVVLKIGGGGAEALLLDGTDVIQALAFRQGALRIRSSMEAHETPVTKKREALERDIRRISDRIVRELGDCSDARMLMLGSDVRLVAEVLDPEWEGRRIRAFSADDIEQFAESVLPLPLDELARRFNRSFAEIRTLSPALLTWVGLIRRLGHETVYVAGSTMRDGALREMAVGGGWIAEFAPQILRSAVRLGRRFGFREEHGLHTATLATSIFRALQSEHGLESRHELLLEVAAVLHDIGSCINDRGHHKHSMYMIMNSELFGLGAADLLLVALIARYHRRATPRSNHLGYMTLPHADRLVVAKLAAILRVADALDRSESQRIRNITCDREGDRFVITVPDVHDLLLEQIAVDQKGTLFEDTYGMQVHLRPA